MYTKNSNKGFTVLELLSSITIVMILASLLMGAIGASYEKSKQAKCIYNQHQLISGVLLYAVDQDHFPTILTQMGNEYLHPQTTYASSSGILGLNDLQAASSITYYQGGSDILNCPKVKGSVFDNPPVYSYGMNAFIVDSNYNSISTPSEVMVVADSNTATFTVVSELPMRHLFGALAGYADGHVEWAKEFVPLSSGSDGGYFDIDEGGVVTSGEYNTEVNPLLAQVSYGGWYWECDGWCHPEYLFDFLDVYLSMEVTDPATGEVNSYNMTDPDGEGVDGWWEDVDFESFSMFEDPGTLPAGAEINFTATANWWLPSYEWSYSGGWQTVWVNQNYAVYNTNDHINEQVFVLQNGDAVPDYEGFTDPIGQQTSVGEAIADYIVEDEFGNLSISLGESQAIYFWEISHNYYDYDEFDDPPSGVDFNDLVFFIDFENP